MSDQAQVSQPTQSLATLPDKGKKVLKKRIGVMERYGLASLLIKEVVENGSNVSWQDIANKLEEYVAREYGVEITLYPTNLSNYYRKIQEGGNLIGSGPAAQRREMGENWIKSLQAIYDQAMDMRVLLRTSYDNRNVDDYVRLSKGLTDIMKMLSEIHREANYEQIVKDKMVAQISTIIDILKTYDFEPLIGDNFTKQHTSEKRWANGMYGLCGVTPHKISELRLHLLRHLIGNLPEYSDSFIRSKSDVRVKPVMENAVVIKEEPDAEVTNSETPTTS